jgi:Tol biopolymer transport system component
MAMRTRLLPLLLLPLAALAPACSNDDSNPFDQFSFSRPPSADAILLYLSGAWAEEPGAPREVYALDADGTTERLTSCTQRSEPCNFLEVAPSSNPARIVAVRGAIGGDPQASALYFVDLDRSVETIIAPARRVQGADWSQDDSLVIYSNGDVENLSAVQPNGDEDRALTESPDLRERSPRLDPTLTYATYEGLEQTPGKSRIYLYLGQDNSSVPLTRGGPGTDPLEGTPYTVGSDASPTPSPNGQFVVFRRLTGTGNGGLGNWDILYANVSDPEAEPEVLVSGGDVARGAPDWGPDGRIVFVETDASAGESRLVAVQPSSGERQVLYVEDAGFGMVGPRWLR